MQFGLIGKSLSHSFSKAYFDEKFRKMGLEDCRYDLFELSDIEELPALIARHPNLRGFNVTIPYKMSILPHLNALSKTAAAIGAVNTVLVAREGNDTLLTGFNTDFEGFIQSLPPDGAPHRAMVIGAGGAAAAVMYALRGMGIPYRQVSRKGGGGQLEITRVSAKDIEDCPFIINCTPVGTRGEPQRLLSLPYEALTPNHYLYDLVYNPGVTPFLEEGRRRGARVQNGLEMLRLQAEAAWRIWNG